MTWEHKPHRIKNAGISRRFLLFQLWTPAQDLDDDDFFALTGIRNLPPQDRCKHGITPVFLSEFNKNQQFIAR